MKTLLGLILTKVLGATFPGHGVCKQILCMHVGNDLFAKLYPSAWRFGLGLIDATIGCKLMWLH